MMLWFVLTAMCSAAAVVVAIPLIRRYESSGENGAADSSIYRDQLKEIERDRDAGQINPDEADLAKIEIQRRLLASLKTSDTRRPVSPVWRSVALVSATGFVVLGAVNLYAVNGRPDLPAAPNAAPVPDTNAVTGNAPILPAAPANTGAGDVDNMIGNLAAKLKQNPGDAEGWRMLGWSYFNTQHYDESAQAYAKAIDLVPENIDYQSAYAEAVVQAADGIVTPKAQQIFEVVLQKNSKEERARFYLALAREQAGELRAALDMWIALLGDAPKDAGWLVDVRQRINELGKKTSRDVTAILAGGTAPASGQNTTLAAADQQASVEAMIANLSAKLESNPVDRDGWAMMIRSLKVKGDLPAAQAALSKALIVFKDDPSTSTQIAALAKSLGVGAAEAPATTAPAISQEDVAAVTALPAQDQQVMIRGMVDRLAEKLAESPHDADGWMRLIRARMVLDQPGLARDALRKAMAEFSGDAEASSQIATIARELGVAQD